MKTVIFERITPLYTPVVWWYSLRGYRLFYLHQSGRAWTTTSLKPLTLCEPLYKWNNPAANNVFNRTELEYPNQYSQNKLIQKVLAELNDEGVHLAYKKGLSLYLERECFSELLCKRLSQTLPEEEKILLVPAVEQWGSTNTSGKVGGRVFNPWWVRIIGVLQNFGEKLIGLGLLVFTFLKGFRHFQSQLETTAEFAVAIVSPTREFSNDVRSVDFLLDGKSIRQDNTLFIPLVPLTQKQKEELNKKKLRFAMPDESLRGWELIHSLRWVLQLSWHSLWEPGWLTRTTGFLLREYWKWSKFLKRHSVKHFVSYADFGLRHYGRNIALKQHGTQTWYYMDASNMTVGCTTNADGLVNRHLYWSYLYYHSFVAWGPLYTRYMQVHHQGVQRYFNVGCLWSEYVASLQEKGDQSSLKKLLHKKIWHPGLRLIAVFDSTYDNETMTNYGDGEEFVLGILKLLKLRDDLFILFKEKKPRNYHASHGSRGRLEAVYAELERHERCYFIGYQASGSEIIAVSDITIAFPFTSCVLEAVGAGRRGLFFDPTHKHSRSFYNQIPGLVVRSMEELTHRIDELLTTSDLEYKAYLDLYFRNDIDPFLDGNGISRFRAMLTCNGISTPMNIQ